MKGNLMFIASVLAADAILIAVLIIGVALLTTYGMPLINFVNIPAPLGLP